MDYKLRNVPTTANNKDNSTILRCGSNKNRGEPDSSASLHEIQHTLEGCSLSVTSLPSQKQKGAAVQSNEATLSRKEASAHEMDVAEHEKMCKLEPSGKIDAGKIDARADISRKACGSLPVLLGRTKALPEDWLDTIADNQMRQFGTLNDDTPAMAFAQANLQALMKRQRIRATRHEPFRV